MATPALHDKQAPARQGQTRPPADQDDQEWTRVRRKTRRGANPRQGLSHAGPKSDLSSQVPTPRPAAASDLSAQEIEDQHRRITEQWLDSECHRELQDIINTKADPVRISQAVCFGIGTFDPEDGAWEVKRRTHIQLAAFLSIASLLEERQKTPIKCYFQEPVFSKNDAEFIRRLGHHVVDTPAGFALVNESTLVFGVHLYREVYSQAIALAVPAVFVGTGCDIWDNYHDARHLDWERLRKVDADCDKIKFPQDKGYTTFSSTSFHWRRPDSG